MATRYAHTNIIAHDWEKLAHFYCEVFSCELLEPKRDLSGEWLERGTRVTGAHIRGAHLRLPGHGEKGPTLEIFHYDEVLDAPPVAANRRGFGHVAFEVDDVEVTLAAMERAGGSRHAEVVSSEVPGAGVVSFTYAKDPEGNLVELQSWRALAP
jgi:glyoxylase I family protein